MHVKLTHLMGTTSKKVFRRHHNKKGNAKRNRC